MTLDLYDTDKTQKLSRFLTLFFEIFQKKKNLDLTIWTFIPLSLVISLSDSSISNNSHFKYLKVYIFIPKY